MTTGKVTAVDAAVPWRVRDAALLLALGLGTLLLSLLAAQGLYRLQGSPMAVPPQPPPLLSALAGDLFYAVILVGVWLLVARRYSVGWGAIGLRLPERTSWWPTLGLGAFLACALVAVTTALAWGVEASGLRVQMTPVTDVGTPNSSLFGLAIFGSLVLTPIAEEVLFRGVLYQSLRKHMGVTSGAVCSAIVFALLHLRPAVAPQLLVLGIVLALAFERSRSLYPSIVMHAAYNGVILLLTLNVIHIGGA